jgi:hypothetical protein
MFYENYVEQVILILFLSKKQNTIINYLEINYKLPGIYYHQTTFYERIIY